MAAPAPPATYLALVPPVADRTTGPDALPMPDQTAARLAAIEARLDRIEAALGTGLPPTHPAARAIARRELAQAEADRRAVRRAAPAAAAPPVYLTTAQAAAALSVSTSTVLALIRRGELAALALRSGGRVVSWRIPESALSALPPVVKR